MMVFHLKNMSPDEHQLLSARVFYMNLELPSRTWASGRTMMMTCHLEDNPARHQLLHGSFCNRISLPQRALVLDTLLVLQVVG
jgi:hypothetical protein